MPRIPIKDGFVDLNEVGGVMRKLVISFETPAETNRVRNVLGPALHEGRVRVGYDAPTIDNQIQLDILP